MKRIHTLLLAIVAISCGSVAAIVYKRDQQITAAAREIQKDIRAAEKARNDEQQRQNDIIANQNARQRAAMADEEARLIVRDKLQDLMRVAHGVALRAAEESDAGKPITPATAKKLVEIRDEVAEIERDRTYPDIQAAATKAKEALNSGAFMRIVAAENVVLGLPRSTP